MPRFTNFSSSAHGAGLFLADRADRDDQFVLLDRGVGVLEVEAVGHFPLGLVDRVAQFLAVDFGDDVE